MRAAWLLALAACERFDLDKPIDVVPASDWTELERATLAASARCWKLRFGLDFDVVSHPTHDQSVYFDFDTLACWDSGGRYLPGDLPGDPAHDSICPLSDVAAVGFPDPATALFMLATHELGHAANIGNVLDPSTHNTEELLAVMGGNQAVTLAWRCILEGNTDCGPAFQDFDQQALLAANTSFSPTPACANVELVPDATVHIACGCP